MGSYSLVLWITQCQKEEFWNMKITFQPQKDCLWKESWVGIEAEDQGLLLPKTRWEVFSTTNDTTKALTDTLLSKSPFTWDFNLGLINETIGCIIFNSFWIVQVYFFMTYQESTFQITISLFLDRSVGKCL